MKTYKIKQRVETVDGINRWIEICDGDGDMIKDRFERLKQLAKPGMVIALVIFEEQILERYDAEQSFAADAPREVAM